MSTLVPIPLHVLSVEEKKLAYKLSTSTRVAFDVMITIAMSIALVVYFPDKLGAYTPPSKAVSLLRARSTKEAK